MRIQTRIVVTLIAFAYCVWASATLVRHFAGTPDAMLHFLFVAPAIACLITAVGHAIERGHNLVRGWEEAPGWRAVPGWALGLQYGGMLFFAWRAVWMFFSWDGMFYFPVWCALALTLYRWHPRSIPCT